VSRPTVRPAEWIVKTGRASNLKSQSVAFGRSRPTRTPTEGSPQGGEAADRLLDCDAQSPGTGRQSHVRSARNPADSAGEQQPDSRGILKPGRWPRSLLPGIAAHSAPSRAETVYGTTWLDARLSRPSTGRSRRSDAGALAPTKGQCEPPYATDSDGTCQLPAANIRHGSAQLCSGRDFRKMFPATTRHRGPAQHPSAATFARTGPRARGPGPAS
jgi:hypothetical protein